MKRTLIIPDLMAIPAEYHALFSNAAVYDSSCSPEAKVYYIDKDKGYFLKCAPKGSLATEAELTRFYHSKGLATDVLSYRSDTNDWMLTEQVVGEDCTFASYLETPKKLCDKTAELLCMLHETDYTGCPVMNRMESYRAVAERNYYEKSYDSSHFPDSFGYPSAEAAWKVVESSAHLFKNDTLLHGDYCLPNIILNDWNFSGFIDLGNGGVGDRHVDLFWGTWTLFFNLKTNAFFDRFLDAYGRKYIEPEMLKIVAAFEVFG